MTDQERQQWKPSTVEEAIWQQLGETNRLLTAIEGHARFLYGVAMFFLILACLGLGAWLLAVFGAFG